MRICPCAMYTSYLPKKGDSEMVSDSYDFYERGKSTFLSFLLGFVRYLIADNKKSCVTLANI